MAGNSADIQIEILEFWFAPGRDENWFEKSAEFDIAVRTALLPHYEPAASGAYDDWLDTPRGCLALAILLDQVPRNVFRDDPRAFATDEKARQVVCHAVAQGLDAQLSQTERLFLYMPLEHSESLADQDRCVELVAKLDADPSWLDYAERHRQIIARFGRFPHRNRVLNRRSTESEEAFLCEPDSSF